MEQKIKMALVYSNMTQADLARAIGSSPANFNQRLKKGRFTKEEYEQMAQIMGAAYRAEFVFPDGTTF